ncbi:MAG TPA: hypothetical protein VK395_17485 [Gemmataceae bacterium]|nr:hypothetical protein [Gemmataceae bacterium]
MYELALPCRPAATLNVSLWLKPVAITLLLHVTLMCGYVTLWGGDVSALVCADQSKIGRWPYEEVTTGFKTGGFDGQFYYTLARAPWQLQKAFIDLPPLRHSRILFLALGWLLSAGGDPVLLLWALPALNLACICGLSGLGAVYASHHGRSPLWGCLLPIVVNAAAPALRDLTDPLATFAVTGFLMSWLLGQGQRAQCAWALAAMLSREQNVAIVLIVLGNALTKRLWQRSLWLAAALAIFLAWMATLRHAYGAWPFLSGNLALPFAGIIYRLMHGNGIVGSHSIPIHMLAIGFLLLQVGLSICMIFLRAEHTVLFIALAGVILVTLAGIPIYMNGQSYTRVFLWMPLAIWFWSMQTGRSWPVWLLTPAFLWPCFALVQVWQS